MVSAASGRDLAADNPIEPALTALMPALLAYFVRRVQPTEDAADCLSETMATLWMRRQSMPAEAEDARKWSYGVARNVLANYRRGAVRRFALVDRLRSELTLHEETVMPDSGLAQALQQLDDKDKELILLVAWDGLGVAEAGSLFKLSPDASRARYSRARRRLRTLLEGTDGGREADETMTSRKGPQRAHHSTS